MQLAPVVPPTSALPPSIINRPQQLTPASSVTDEDHRHSSTSSGASGKGYPEHRSSYSHHSSFHNRGRSGSDPRQDDYYFYHTGSTSNSIMNSRRGSVQSIEKGRLSDDAIDAKKADPQVRLPPITSLFAAVEPAPPPPPAHVPPPPPPQPPQSYHTPREHQNPHFVPRDPLPSQSYYSPPTSYPHMPPYRRQSIFSTYASSVTSSPQIPSYPPTSHHYPPPPHHSPHGSIPYRTPSPPLYQQRHVSIPPNYPPSYHLQPRPPHPSSLVTSRSGPSTFVLSHRTNSASPAERYMCHECNKSFSRPSSLRIHMFSHTGEKPFVCPEPGCTKRFSVRSNMRRHMKVHTEQAMAESASDAGIGRGIGPSGYHAESVKDDEGASETSVTSPGLGVTHRPRQGSRSSI